jgi:hypothetical protein
MQVDDLKNESALRERYNKSKNEVWTQGIRLNPVEPFRFVTCLTLNPPSGPVQNNQQIFVSTYIITSVNILNPFF